MSKLNNAPRKLLSYVYLAPSRWITMTDDLDKTVQMKHETFSLYGRSSDSSFEPDSNDYMKPR